MVGFLTGPYKYVNLDDLVPGALKLTAIYRAGVEEVLQRRDVDCLMLVDQSMGLTQLVNVRQNITTSGRRRLSMLPAQRERCVVIQQRFFCRQKNIFRRSFIVSLFFFLFVFLGFS